MNRRAFLCCLAATVASGRVEAGSLGRVYAPGGLALGGVDPVSYFTEGHPVMGSPRTALMWMGVTWLFASKESRALFEMDPYHYAPAFGGYCAYALSRGYIASGDPRAFTILNDRLFLTHSLALRRIWAVDASGNIALAEANWPEVLD